ncbi:hypothetical protein LAZ67_4000783 [Cordylochernes scorpioides]|uniref:Uncharacterized protein n=1 Tax=Cordylochernes scorpioides TaxID=51811 RepID=A0ABY6KBP9_9ARAC|nr:hypothetical protein LAZ67_4000783 [Cordylochernes scorpioides]
MYIQATCTDLCQPALTSTEYTGPGPDKAISFKGNSRDLAILPLTGSTLDSQVERLTIEIQTAMSRAGMRREIRSGGLRSKPWYDEECYTA